MTSAVCFTCCESSSLVAFILHVPCEVFCDLTYVTFIRGVSVDGPRLVISTSDNLEATRVPFSSIEDAIQDPTIFIPIVWLPGGEGVAHDRNTNSRAGSREVLSEVSGSSKTIVGTEAGLCEARV